jgi:hypothetical protein
MSYSAYNGWDIIPVPASPAPQAVTLKMNDAVAVVQSPFTMQTQVQQWPGADFWEAEITLPPMKRKDATKWIAWLMALRGQANVFEIGDPLGKTPQGVPTGTPVNDGTHIAGTYILNTRGWTANSTNNLLPGDYLQLGNSLYVVAGVNPVNADASGKATVEIWPSLRVALADGNPITTSDCKGLFRLSSNQRSWSADDAKIYSISFKAIEAR